MNVLRVQNVRYLRLTSQSKNPHVRATRQFEAVHSDVCGPFPQTLHGSKYAISFMDDLSTRQLFLSTVVQPCNVTGLTLRLDNGGSFFAILLARKKFLHSNLLKAFVLLIKKWYSRALLANNF